MAARKKVRKYTFLTEKDVKAIRRRLVRDVETLSSIADDYDVALATISWIADGRTWSDTVVPGWKPYLNNRLKMKRGRKKKVKVARRKKTVTVKARKKNVKLGRPRKKTVRMKASAKVLREPRAPKRADHAEWSKQFDKGAAPKKTRKMKVVEQAAPAPAAVENLDEKIQTVPAAVVKRRRPQIAPAAVAPEPAAAAPEAPAASQTPAE